MSKKRTYFISRAGADRRWAEVIADVVREAGHEAIHKEQDFPVGASFSHKMMVAAESDCTIVVLSPAYFASEHCLAELNAALADDPLGVRGRIFPVLVAPCKLPRLVGQLAYLDLQQIDEDTARQRLRTALLKGTLDVAPTSVLPGGTASPAVMPWLRRIGVPMGALAAMVGAIALFIPLGGRSQRRGPGPAPAPSAPVANVPQPPTQTSPALRIESLEVKRYHGNSKQLLGTMGVLTWNARFNDNVRVLARLSAPAYCYLLALNPDGTVQFCPKAKEQTPPSLTSEVVYPPDDSEDLFGLTDGVGLQAFVLIASSHPLPAFADWPERDTLSWKRATADVVWRFDGRELTSVRDPKRGEQRRPADAAPEPLAAACRYLSKLPGIDAVQATAFPVLPVDETEPAAQQPP
jgi:hypothetical protein